MQNTLIFRDYSESETIPSIENTYTILSKIANTSALTDSIFIFNRRANVVIGSGGKFDSDIFFSEIYKYFDYNLSYWDSYKEPLSAISTLPPSFCSIKGGDDVSLIPVVFSSIGSLPSTSIVIMNIDVNKITGNTLRTGMNRGENIFLINKYTGTYFFPKGSSFGQNNKQLLEKILKEITLNRTISFDYKSDKKYYVVCTSPTDSVWGYCYVSVMPYSDIYRNMYNDTFWLIILFLSIIIGYFIVMMVIFRKLSPSFQALSNVSKTLKAGESSAGYGLFRYINENIEHITSQNLELKERMSNVLPVYYQKLLTKILNDNDDGQDLAVEFEKANFEYENFISVAVRFYFSYKTYSPFYRTKTDMIRFFENTFSEKYHAYSLPSNEDTLYVILNVDDSVSKTDVENLINSTFNTFTEDMDYMDIIYGIGNNYKGLDGLKMSHREAIDNLLEIKQQKRIIIPASNLKSYKSQLLDEQKLSNYLISGRYEAAKAYIADFTDGIKDSKDSANMQVYISVLNVLFNIMALRNIGLEHGQNAVKLISDIIEKPKKEIDEYIDSLIVMIEDNTQMYNSKLNINDVISYIEKHFNEDLYLDMLAEKFDTNSKYLSRRIKQHIHLGFKDYLLKLRIDNAKKLLTETDMKINDVAASCGIENRSTFIKAFKKICGITPSEYRNMLK